MPATGHKHHKATLPTSTVKEMRALYSRLQKEGRIGMGGIGYGWFANRFGCSPSTARDILLYRTRASS